MNLKQGCRGWWIALAAALADRLTKLLVAWLRPHGGVLVPGILNLRPVENRGIAFSMLSGKGLGLVLFTAALIAGLVAWLVTHPDAPTLLRTGLWLIAGGGLGNLYDRLAMGSVSDFIELAFMRFAVFNVADICICVGAGLVLLGSFTGDRTDGK
ncbi:MAG: signal peptidase II [Oscillospiraceae bacterium]|nr:signal peptidase II [Oscillospiraceae bacterium]